MDAETMRRNGDTEPSIAYWATQTVYWNGQPVTVLAPKPERGTPVSQTDEE